MIRVRYLLYIGLFIYLLDLNKIGTDAQSGENKSKDNSKESSSETKSKDNSKESSSETKEEEKMFVKSLHDKSRETSSGEHLEIAFNPNCGLLKIFGPAYLQNNCLLNDAIGLYKLYKKYSLAIKALI